MLIICCTVGRDSSPLCSLRGPPCCGHDTALCWCTDRHQGQGELLMKCAWREEGRNVKWNSVISIVVEVEHSMHQDYEQLERWGGIECRVVEERVVCVRWRRGLCEVVEERVVWGGMRDFGVAMLITWREVWTAARRGSNCRGWLEVTRQKVQRVHRHWPCATSSNTIIWTYKFTLHTVHLMHAILIFSPSKGSGSGVAK